MIDQTGANIQFGGLNHGLASAAYQLPGGFSRPMAKPVPTTRMTNSASRKFRIGAPAPYLPITPNKRRWITSAKAIPAASSA
jgi:hypothetical protein